MLRHARAEARQVERELLAVQVAALDPYEEAPFHRREHVAQREAALVVGLTLVAGRGDDGIHDDDRIALLVGLHDHDPLQDADLVAGESDPCGLAHEHEHPLGETTQVVVEPLHLVRAHPQHRIGVLADVRQRDAASNLALGIERTVARFCVRVRHGGSLGAGDVLAGAADGQEPRMYARISTYELPEDRREDGTRAFGDALREIADTDGFAGGQFLVSCDGERAMTVVFWDSRDAMEASRVKASRLRSEAAHQADGGVVSAEEFVVEVDVSAKSALT